MCELCFAVVAGCGRGSLKWLFREKVLKKKQVAPPSKGHKVILSSSEILNDAGEGKNK